MVCQCEFFMTTVRLLIGFSHESCHKDCKVINKCEKWDFIVIMELLNFPGTPSGSKIMKLSNLWEFTDRESALFKPEVKFWFTLD